MKDRIIGLLLLLFAVMYLDSLDKRHYTMQPVLRVTVDSDQEFPEMNRSDI